MGALPQVPSPSMPAIDYSRFNNLDVSDSEDEDAKRAQPVAPEERSELLKDLPPELSPDLSLVLAARHGQDNVVQALLDSGASVNATDPHGASALFRAVEGGIDNRKVIELLLKRGASVDQQNDSGETAVARAAAVGTTELVSALFDTSVSPTDMTRGVALAAASAAGNKSTAEFLVKKNALPLMASEGRLPLNSWAGHGDLGMVELMVQKKANVNASDDKGSPLACAVRSGSDAVVQWLCTQGAAINSVESGRPALLDAVEHSNEGVAAKLVSTLLELGANVEQASTGAKGTSPLVAAACMGRTAIARLLLDGRADVGAADPAGRRALPCAAVLSSMDLCTLFLERKAEINQRGTSGAQAVSGGVTPLSIAVASGSLALVEVFLAAGSDTEAVDERDFRPLMSAARGGHVAVSARLLQAKVDVNAQQVGSDKTALILAAGNGSVEISQALLLAGADVEARASTGVRALHAAAGAGHEAVCRCLVDRGASVTALGPGDQDAMSVAKAAGYDDLSQVLTTLKVG